MKVKINKNAAKVIKKELENENNQGKMLRVYVSHLHGNHAHYGISFDTPKETDEIVKTDKDIDVLLESGNEWLDGVWIQYFYVPEEGFVITNPSKGHSHHH
ncbi:iron-sulfur cluster assembly accessory protein [Caldibacillus thermolactis]|jgi:Fe-S cluster assembly iron-binding protein IscA|uniref:Iron-sulfur cluster assembly accessory protein n=1 Tax=Pallidibacillus thermolactis TaxID=251051 RepID=A0ABT2WHP5_9BACI|nr:iron-sulfur cluster assembly accessory protein [Pallidibacillus thermolactis]MCU9595070.1 iron-sulfur cluster assembly accessory protein [Pallidibacillus thermolactis]MCU9602364.1 iron-sulfur cluster assembly accessory protein [Pallidibacillus thermolactis subsp. kokeshiiformis]